MLIRDLGVALGPQRASLFMGAQTLISSYSISPSLRYPVFTHYPKLSFPQQRGGSASQPVMHHQNRFSFRQLSPWAGLGKEQEQQLSQPPALHIHRHHLKVMSSPGPSGCWRKINKRYSTFVLSAVTRSAGFFSGLQQQLDLELTEKKSCSNASSLSAFNHLAPSLTLQKVNRQTRHSG